VATRVRPMWPSVSSLPSEANGCASDSTSRRKPGYILTVYGPRIVPIDLLSLVEPVSDMEFEENEGA